MRLECGVNKLWYLYFSAPKLTRFGSPADHARVTNAFIVSYSITLIPILTCLFYVLHFDNPISLHLVFFKNSCQTQLCTKFIHIYRVAQNKMPHRRICNISVTSGLILKILEARLKVQWIHCIPLDSEKCQDYAASRIFILSYFILSHPVRTILLLIAEVKRNAELDIY